MATPLIASADLPENTPGGPQSATPDVAPPIAPAPLADRPRRSVGIIEIILIALGLAALMAGELALCKPKAIFNGPFILDETLTDSIVRDPSIPHSIAAVRHGVDTNPPIYHLILRGFWMALHPLFHGSPRVTLRAFSMLCTWLALVGAYAILRRGFSMAVALVAVLAIWAHPDLIEQSASARFYAPLLLASVAMCLSLQMRGSGVMRGILAALCAMLLCTLHYFGILVLGSLVLATLLIDEGGLWTRILRVLPTIAGPLALLPFLPFIRTQHEGISIKTWIDPITFHLARDFMQMVLCPLSLLIAVLIWAIGKLIERSRPMEEPIDRLSIRVATVPMLSLILVPLIIVAFSAVVQSALIPRYAIATVLSVGALVALLAQNRSGPLLFLLAIGLSGYTAMELRSVAGSRLGDLNILTTERNEMEGEQPPLPIVFANRADAAQLQAFAPDLASRIMLIDERQPGVELRNFRTYEIEMGTKVAAFYPMPPLLTPDQLKAMGRFHLMAPTEDWQSLLLEVPMKHVSGDVYEPLK
jgi:Na+-transporting methylmalonyl-CoA/oxaloacetate decarboxylase gamma subunit